MYTHKCVLYVLNAKEYLPRISSISLLLVTAFRETKVTTPQKKVVEEEKVVQEVDEDSKTSENGDTKETKENGSSEEKEVDEKEVESTENGDSTGMFLYYRKTFSRYCSILLAYLCFKGKQDDR